MLTNVRPAASCIDWQAGWPIMSVEFGCLVVLPMAKITIQRLRKPLIWLLLPVALLTGRPMIGCVCSDGTYKVSCEKLIGSLVWSQATGNHGESCCPTANSAHCPACHKPAHTGDGASAQSQCRCRGIENNLKLTSPTNLDQERDSAFVAFTISEVFCSSPLVSHDLGSPLRNDLPPPDRVVLFLHLTI